jgi:predicted dienelactone hydrolase
MFNTRRVLGYWTVVMVVLMLSVSVFVSVVSAQDSEGTERTGFRPDAPPYAICGPHPVGVQDFVLDADSERPLVGSIWYPALNPEGLEELATYDIGLAEVVPAFNVWHGRAIQNAEPDIASGPYPLLVYSPGNGGSRFYGSFMHDHLASQGFVVISVDHTGNTLAENMVDPQAVADYRYATMIHRPHDVTRQIDYAETLSTGEWAGLIDLEHVGVYGVSFGGYSALMAGGAQLDLEYFQTWCADKPDDPSCASILGREPEMAALAGLDAVPDGLWPSLDDPRVDAIVPIVPGRGVSIGPDGAAGIDVPIMMIVSGSDTIVNPEEYLMLYEGIDSEKTLVWFEHADHMLIGGLCPEAWQAFPIYCWDPVWDLDRAHDLYNHYLNAFFSAELKDDADAAAALAPDVVQFPGISYETTEF